MDINRNGKPMFHLFPCIKMQWKHHQRCFQMHVTFAFISNVSDFKDNLEMLSVRYPNEPVQAFLYHGAPANRHWAVGEPSRSRRGAVGEPSSNIRQSQAVSTWVNWCQGNIKLTGTLSKDVKQLREATLERHLQSFEWLQWYKCLLTYLKESNNHMYLESSLMMFPLPFIAPEQMEHLLTIAININ